MFREKVRLNENGATLILALLFLLILTALGLAIVMNSQIDNAISKNYSKTIRATFTAQTGIERIKPYLLYDIQKDPNGWSNNILWVPDGTAGAGQGGTSSCPGVPATSDCFDLTGAPNLQPYDIVNTLADAQSNSVWAPENAAGWGTYGYQLLFRNIAQGAGFDRNKICVDSGGFSDSTLGLMGTPSRGSDLVEQCLVGEDISIWNNIIFIEGGATSGMGNFKIHGNVHILGPPKPPPSATINVTVKGNQGWYNDYNSGTPMTSTLKAVLDPLEANRTSLDAKIRDKNGLIDAQNGSVEYGTPSIPYDAVFGCDDCGGVYGFTNFASTMVRTLEMGPYDVPASVLNKIKVPLLGDQYKDDKDVLYPNYEGYLIGVANAGGVANNNLPGVLGLRLASALNQSNWSMNFGNSTTEAQGSLADRLMNQTMRNNLFAANVNTSANANPVQQVIFDGTGSNPVMSPTIGANRTFMLVAVDDVNDVAIVYKEVQPFNRNVDKDLGGPGGFSSVHTTRQVHGFVIARMNTTLPTLSGLNFHVDIDGNNLDGVAGNYNSSFATFNVGASDSMNLLRKAVNALWLASKGACAADSATPCWNQANSASWDATISPALYQGPSPFPFYVGDTTKLVGAGVIQMPDQFQFNASGSTNPGLRYAGRFSFFTEETGGSSNATTSGYADISSGPRPVPSYTAGGATYSFPCQNAMGIMAANRIDMGDPSGTHDEYAGAFYAYQLLKIQKQIQILGAIVSLDFDLLGGGNPDWFQAMQISKCLPPEMIGKEPIVYIRSQSYSDR
jgi:hypothetical protein